jgi:O-antigen/teichoic acid export membrane protein
VGVASGLSGALDLVTNLACLWLWVSPADLGIATIAGAAFPVIERLAFLGLGAAAVRTDDGDRVALSSIFWLGVVSSLVVLIGALIGAPWIGAAFDEPIVGTLVCAYAVKLVVQNVYIVSEAVLRRELRFQALSKVRIAATIADAAAKLVAAYLGAGVWCFAIGPFAGAVVTAIGMQICSPWWPAFVFDRKRAIAAVKFGAQVSVSEILYFAYTSADYVVIDRVFGAAAVGAYRLAYELVLDVVRLISLITAEIAFPSFARLVGDRRAAGDLLIRFTRANLRLVAPVLVVIAVAADDLLAILYPPLGPVAATAARILCVVGALRAMSFVLPSMLAGLGHARDALVYNVVAAILLPAAFVVAASGWQADGYLAIAWAWALVYPLAFALLLWLALARTGLRLGQYVSGILPVLVIAALATAAALGARAIVPEAPWPRALATAAATLVSYLALDLLARRFKPAG